MYSLICSLVCTYQHLNVFLQLIIVITIITGDSTQKSALRGEVGVSTQAQLNN